MLIETHRRTRHGELEPGDVGHAIFRCDICSAEKDALDANYEEERTGECNRCCANRCAAETAREELLAEAARSPLFASTVQIVRDAVLTANRRLATRAYGAELYEAGGTVRTVA
jgi:hypothetical protein